MATNYVPRRERQAIEPSNQFGEPSIFKRGESTEIAVWRSEYNGKRQVSLAKRHPQSTGGFWKSGGVTNLDAELSAAVASQMVGWTIPDVDGVDSPAVEAPPKRSTRGRKAAAK